MGFLLFRIWLLCCCWLVLVSLQMVLSRHQTAYTELWPQGVYADHEETLKHYVSYWPHERQEFHSEFEDSSLSEHHISSKMEHYNPVSIHQTKGVRHYTSMMMLYTMPSVLLTVFTFPITIILLMQILRYIISLQTSFTQSMASSVSNSAAHRSSSSESLSEVSSQLDKAVHKYESNQ